MICNLFVITGYLHHGLTADDLGVPNAADCVEGYPGVSCINGFDRDGGNHGVTNTYRGPKLQGLADIDSPRTGQLGAKNRRNIPGRKHPMSNSAAKLCAGTELIIQMQRIHITRDAGVVGDIGGGHGAGEAGGQARLQLFQSVAVGG